MENCIAAHVCPDSGITLFFSKEAGLEEKPLQELLKPYRLRISEIKTLDQPPY